MTNDEKNPKSEARILFRHSDFKYSVFSETLASTSGKHEIPKGRNHEKEGN